MSDRLTRARAAIEEAGLDALLVTNPYNRRYLSGLHGLIGLARGEHRGACWRRTSAI